MALAFNITKTVQIQSFAKTDGVWIHWQTVQIDFQALLKQIYPRST